MNIHQPIIITLSHTQLSRTSSMVIMDSHIETDQSNMISNPIGNVVTIVDTLPTYPVIESTSTTNPPAQLSPTRSMPKEDTNISNTYRELLENDMEQQIFIPIESSCQIKLLQL